jgi:hypothetical protein
MREKTGGILNQLLETLGLKLSQGIVFDGVADLEGVAADLTVFDVAVPVNREVQDHRDLFAAKWTGEGVFHDQYATANPSRITNGAGRTGPYAVFNVRVNSPSTMP